MTRTAGTPPPLASHSPNTETTFTHIRLPGRSLSEMPQQTTGASQQVETTTSVSHRQLPEANATPTNPDSGTVNPYMNRLNWQPAHKAIQSRSWLRDSTSLSGAAPGTSGIAGVDTHFRGMSTLDVKDTAYHHPAPSGFTDMTGLASAGVHGVRPSQRPLGGLAFAESPNKPSKKTLQSIGGQGGKMGGVTVGGIAWNVDAGDSVDEDDLQPAHNFHTSSNLFSAQAGLVQVRSAGRSGVYTYCLLLPCTRCMMIASLISTSHAHTHTRDLLQERSATNSRCWEL